MSGSRPLQLQCPDRIDFGNDDVRSQSLRRAFATPRPHQPYRAITTLRQRAAHWWRDMTSRHRGLARAVTIVEEMLVIASFTAMMDTSAFRLGHGAADESRRVWSLRSSNHIGTRSVRLVSSMETRSAPSSMVNCGLCSRAGSKCE